MSNISYVGKYAFAGCSSLTSITASEATYIEEYAFANCTSLQTASFPNCTTISVNAFNNCTHSFSGSFPNVTGIYVDAFNDANMPIFDFPAMSIIGQSQFKGQSYMQKASFPNVSIINSDCFRSCTKLNEIYFPACTSMYSYAFAGCTSLTSWSNVNLGSLSSIGYGGFSNTGFVNLILGSEITNVGEYAFTFCYNLTTFSASNIKNIAYGMFSHCTNLTTVSIPEATYMYSYAFCSCTNLSNIYFPEITTIGASGFQGCTALSSASFSKVGTINQYAFYNCTALRTVDFPKTAQIYSNAFRSCTKLSSLNLPRANIIGSNAFYDCTSFPSEITFQCLTYLSSSAFYNCINLSTIYLGDACSLQNSNAFNSTKITANTGSIYIPTELYSVYYSSANWSYFKTQLVTYDIFNPTNITDSWDTIQQRASSGLASNYYSVGDYKEINISSGTVDTMLVTSKTVRAVIIGINHNASLEGNNLIHFAIGDDSSGNRISIFDGKGVRMHTSYSNSQGWQGSYLRTTYLPQFKNLLPSDLQAVIKPVTKYSINSKSGASASGVTVSSTTENLFLLSVYEIYGEKSPAETLATTEPDYQEMYEYYSHTNNKGFTVSPSRMRTGTTVYGGAWWTRSPRVGDTYSFLVASGRTPSMYGSGANNNYNGLVACFCVG